MSNEFEFPKSVAETRQVMNTGDDRLPADMTPARLTRVRIDQITIGPRHRKVREADAKMLYDDIFAQGLLQPIGVQMTGVGRYKLVFGRTRLRAFEIGVSKAEGAAIGDWETIPAIVYDSAMPKFVAELKEVAENLMRRPLSQAEQEEHRVSYAALLKRLNLVIDRRRTSAKAKTQDELALSPEVTIQPLDVKMKTDLGVSRKTVAQDFKRVSARAAAVARAEGMPEPEPVTATSPPEAIEAAVELSARHTEARSEEKDKLAATGKGDPRKVMPLSPQPDRVITVRIDVDDPQALRDWFRDRMAASVKPFSREYVRTLAQLLLELVG